MNGTTSSSTPSAPAGSNSSNPSNPTNAQQGGEKKPNAALNKFKAAANAVSHPQAVANAAMAAASSGKKRRKGQDLKPIITNEPLGGNQNLSAARGSVRYVASPGGCICWMSGLRDKKGEEGEGFAMAGQTPHPAIPPPALASIPV